jgi:hypothetical protein
LGRVLLRNALICAERSKLTTPFFATSHTRLSAQRSCVADANDHDLVINLSNLRVQ